ncbi:MAG TPA: choice-of-anchor R domain-containing protein [Candidatus Sulfotelmatobacter sp.]|nr:choice-of-anchor R domain-containing protein [Candidatus Sulfotelmatobacter sp.]
MKKILLFVCLLALCSLTVLAQTGANSRALPATEKLAIQVPQIDVPQIEVPPQGDAVALKKIYSNLGPKADPYWVNAHSWLVAGPNAATSAAFAGMPFTPKSNFLLSQVQVAVFYTSGDNQVDLSIYTDAGGIPGTLLAGPVTVTNLAVAGTCCTLTVANFTPVAVTAGTQYWVVADTPLTGVGSDFRGVWNHVAKDIPVSFNRGSGWFADTADNLPAGEVLGTVQ